MNRILKKLSCGILKDAACLPEARQEETQARWKQMDEARYEGISSQQKRWAERGTTPSQKNIP